MATSISAILIPCLKSFNQLQERVERSDYSRKAEVSSASWEDELGRLRVWAANIGAHQTGQSSLDFRLRDASHISKQITKLLGDLDQSLHDIFDELSEDETGPSEDDDLSTASPGDESTTELQQLHEEVINIIDCLYQLSMLIRKPAQHDMLVGSRLGDKAEFEFYDKDHVRNLHPKTGEQISQRLGRAITRRRKYLFYRERHHRKLEKGIEEVQGIRGTTTGSVISKTIATDFKAPNIDFDETYSNSGISETSYAPSLIEGGRVTIPPPPKESVGGKPFECPYCFFVIDIRSTRSWNRHIFKDIKPYVCTFPDCNMPDRLYDSRREWYFHETTEHHREDFVCPLCKDSLVSSKQYERHVARHLEELALFALPRTEIDDAEDDHGDKDVIDARLSRGDDGFALDSASSASPEVGEEGKADFDASIFFREVDDPPSLDTLTHFDPGPPKVIDEEDSTDTGGLLRQRHHEEHNTGRRQEESHAQARWEHRAARRRERQQEERDREQARIQQEQEDRKRLEAETRARRHREEQNFTRRRAADLERQLRQEEYDERRRAAERDEVRRRRDEEIRLQYVEQQRRARARQANIPLDPRHSVIYRDEGHVDKGERFVRAAIRAENLRQFERRAGWPSERYDGEGLRRRNTVDDGETRPAKPGDYSGDEEFSRINRTLLDAETELDEQETYEVEEEKCDTRKGKTRIPGGLVDERALTELGYPFEEEGEMVIILKALNREQIDEVINLSKDIKRNDPTAPALSGIVGFQHHPPMPLPPPQTCFRHPVQEETPVIVPIHPPEHHPNHYRPERQPRRRRRSPTSIINQQREEDDNDSSSPPQAPRGHQRTRSLSSNTRYEVEKEIIRIREIDERNRRERIREDRTEHQPPVVSPFNGEKPALPPARKIILGKLRDKFPKHRDTVREVVAPQKEIPKKDVPSNARWTKINRKLVSPEALEQDGIRFNEYVDHVIVLKAMDLEEIEKYTRKTAEIREKRRMLMTAEPPKPVEPF